MGVKRLVLPPFSVFPQRSSHSERSEESAFWRQTNKSRFLAALGMTGVVNQTTEAGHKNSSPLVKTPGRPRCGKHAMRDVADLDGGLVHGADADHDLVILWQTPVRFAERRHQRLR